MPAAHERFAQSNQPAFPDLHQPSRGNTSFWGKLEILRWPADQAAIKAAAAADNQDIQDRTRRFSDKGCKRTAAG